MLMWALLDSAKSEVREQRHGTWEELTHLVTSHEVSEEKEGKAWMPAVISPGPRKQERVEYWSCLSIDVEAKAEKQVDGIKHVIGPLPPGLPELADRLRTLGWAGVLATSFSHEQPTEAGSLGPRYRLVLPVSRPLAPAEIRPLGMYVGQLLGLTECMDTSCLEAARLFYLPRCPVDRLQLADRAIVEGQPLDVDALLLRGTAEKENNPLPKLASTGKTENANVDCPAQVSYPPQRQSPSVIDEFNAKFDAGQVLEANGYLQCGPDRWIWPGSTSGEPGVVRLPDTGKIYSHHGQDPLRGDALHAHDAFSVWCVLEYQRDVHRAVRAAAEKMGLARTEAGLNVAASQAATASQAGGLLATLQKPHEHELARTIEFGDEPVAPRWVIPGVIGHGVVVIAGAHGVGKTTAILPLAMTAAGLHADDDPLAPKHWRHVCYVTEDPDQAKRILAGIIKHGGLGLSLKTARERFHLIEAHRLSPSYIADVSTVYKERYSRLVGDVPVLPLVVFDTMAAVLEIENENDNSEASRAMAMLKQDFMKLPLWLIGHLAKQNFNRADASGLSLRGGSAFEADAHQILYLVKEQDGSRYLVRGKTRFEATWTELAIDSHCAQAEAQDEYGDAEQVSMRWALTALAQQSRHELRKEAELVAAEASETGMLEEIFEVVGAAWLSGQPLNRQGVKASIKRKSQVVGAGIERLLAEGWLHEIPVPVAERRNPRQSSFLVSLSQAEHELWKLHAGLPADKLQVPDSWKRPAGRNSRAAGRSGENALTAASTLNMDPSVPESFVPLRNTTGGTDGRETKSPRPSVRFNMQGMNGERTGTDGNERQDPQENQIDAQLSTLPEVSE